MALIINGIKVAGIGANGVDGAGVPAGGTTGQMLVKKTDIDHDTEWVDLPSTDSTLKIEGLAADAKATGDLINSNMTTIGSTYETKNDASAKLAEAKAYTDEQIVSSIADWNQNDESAHDYVKNRPGGYIETFDVEVISESTVEFTELTKYPQQYVYTSSILIGYDPEQYKVVIDDVEYILTRTKNRVNCYGNGSLSNFGGEDTGEPILLYTDVNADTGDEWTSIYTTIEGLSHTIAVYRIEETPVIIDEKFLPDSVKAQADWNQNDESASDYVKNRTHYIDTSIEEILPLQEIENTGVLEYSIPYISADYYDGGTLSVVHNGVEYDMQGQYSYGTDCYLLFSLDAPFEIHSYDDGTSALVLYAQETAEVLTVAVYKKTETVVPIDEKFLPDSVKVQPDWSQNDESAPDYVKNRFGGYMTEGKVEVCAETTVTVSKDGLAVSSPWAPSKFEGQYVVVFDNVEYLCTAYADVDGPAIGDMDAQPFKILDSVSAGSPYIYCATAGEHTFSVYEVTETPITIDEKFLPDSVKAQADWSQNDASAPDYVKNRFGGYMTDSCIEVVSEIHCDVTTDGGWGDMGSSFLPVSGTAYKVTFNSEDYVCIGTAQGTNSITLGTNDFSTTPFFIFYAATDGMTTIRCATAGMHTIAIYEIEETPIPIDEKFLPDSVATKEYVDNAIDVSKSLIVTITGDTTNGYLADKTLDEIYAAHNSGTVVLAYLHNIMSSGDAGVVTHDNIYYLEGIDALDSQPMCIYFCNPEGNTLSILSGNVLVNNGSFVTKEYVDSAIGAAIGGSY